MATTDRMQKLREFGMSDYAARVYLALLELGTTEARDASRLSKVPIAKIYSTLEQLQERGLVEVEPGPPKRFTPAPFAVFLRRQRDRLAHEMRELEATEKIVADLFPLRGTASADDRGSYFTLRGRESVVEKFAALIRGAKEDVLLLTADNFTLRGHVEELFAEAAGRGVRLRAMVRVAEGTLPALARIAQHAELRAKACPPGCPHDVAIAVFDSHQLMIVHFVPDDASRYQGKDVAIVAGEGAMVRAVRSVLEPLWGAAEPLEHAAARLSAGLPPTTTAIFHERKRLFDAWVAGVGAATATHDIVSTKAASALPPEMLDALRDAASRGVRTRAIVPVDDAAAGERVREALGPLGELRMPDPGALQRVSILDGREVYFGPSGRDAAHRRPDELTIRTNDPGAVRALREYFDELWAASAPR